MIISIDGTTGLFAPEQMAPGKMALMLPNVSDSNPDALVKEVSDIELQSLIEASYWSQATSEQLAADIDAAFDAHIDSVAAQRGYKRAGVTPSASCIGYAGYPNQYQAEAIKFGQWVADCCALLIAERAKVLAGTRTMPTPAEAIAELPPMVWK